MTTPTTHSYNKTQQLTSILLTAPQYIYFHHFSGLLSCFYLFCLALDDGDVDEAHHIHISLMVDFVAEVSNFCLLFVMSLTLWMVCKIIVSNNCGLKKSPQPSLHAISRFWRKFVLPKSIDKSS